MLTKLAFLATLLANTIAAPLTQDNSIDLPDKASPHSAHTRFMSSKRGGKWVNDCTNGTITGETSSSSPFVADCLQICSNIKGGGTWTVETWMAQHHQLVQHNSCAFGVQTTDARGYVKVGNSDIIDAIHDSITYFEADGLIGARGTFRCQSTGSWIETDWNIFWNGGYAPIPK